MQRTDIVSTLMPERAKQIGFAWSILRESHFAEDAYQDMLIKVFENEGEFEGPKHLRDWSWKVLRNRCYELVRINKTRRALLEDAVLDLVDSELENREPGHLDARADALRACLDGLTEHARNIVQMRFFEGLAGKEVAKRMGRQPDAVYKNLQRSYSTLGECIRRKLTEQGLSS